MLQTEMHPFKIILGGESRENVAEPGDVVIDIHGLEVEKERICLLGSVDEQGFHYVGGDWCGVFKTVLHNGRVVFSGRDVEHGGKRRRQGGVCRLRMGYDGCYGGEGALRTGLVELVTHAGFEFGFHVCTVENVDLRNETAFLDYNSTNALELFIIQKRIDFEVFVNEGNLFWSVIPTL